MNVANGVSTHIYIYSSARDYAVYVHCRDNELFRPSQISYLKRASHSYTRIRQQMYAFVCFENMFETWAAIQMKLSCRSASKNALICINVKTMLTDRLYVEYVTVWWICVCWVNALHAQWHHNIYTTPLLIRVVKTKTQFVIAMSLPLMEFVVCQSFGQSIFISAMMMVFCTLTHTIVL